MVDGLNSTWIHRELQSTILGFPRQVNYTLTDEYPSSEAWLSSSLNIVRGVCLVLISVLGASLNIFMIVAIVPNRRLRTVRNILLAHLGAVGLLSSVLVTPYPALATFHGRWPGGAPVCQAHAFATCVFTSVSVWTIAALSLDKYQTIASPLHHSLTPTLKKMLPCLLIFWTCGLTLSLPPIFGADDFFYHSPLGTCGSRASTSAGRWYTAVLVCLSFIFPFCLMVYCYSHIFRIARTQSGRIAATMLRMVSLIEAPITSSTHSSLSLRGTKAMGTILQFIGSFVVTYLPFTLIIIFEVISGVHANDIVVSIATTLFLAAPFTHASIYGVRNQILRASFLRYLRRKVQHCCTKDKRRGSVKSLTRKPSTGMRIPMKNMATSDEKQYILQRKLLCQTKAVDIQDGAFENKATSLSRPESCEVLPPDNVTYSSRFGDNTDPRNKVVPGPNKVKDKSLVIDDASFTQPSLVCHASMHEISFHSKNIIDEASLEGWEMDELPQCEPGLSTRLSRELDDDSSSDTVSEGPSKLHPLKEIIATFELRKSRETTSLLKSKEKSSFLKPKDKFGRPKRKPGRPHQSWNGEESSAIGACHIESQFEHSFDVEECLA